MRCFIVSQDKVQIFGNNWLSQSTIPSHGELSFDFGNIYLFPAGNDAYDQHYFPCEYKFLEPIIMERQHVGYHLFGPHKVQPMLFGELVFFDDMISPDAALLGCTSPSFNSSTGKELPASWYACCNIPKQRCLNFQSSDAVELMDAIDSELFVESFVAAGLTVPSTLIESFRKNFSRMHMLERFTFWAALFKKCHFLQSNNNDQTWMLDKFSFPEHPKENFELPLSADNPNDVARVYNFIRNIPFHSNVRTIDYKQRKYLESQLIPLGETNKTPSSISAEDQNFDLGSKLLTTGSLEFKECKLIFVNQEKELKRSGPIRRLFKKNPYIVAELWKSRNHCYYISPERQKGTGLALTK